MLYLILLTFGVFIIFWLGDFYLTVKTVKYLGNGAEINPIIKFLLRGRGRLIYLFKPIELLAFLYLLWFINKFEGIISFKILLVFIFVYSLLVINNAHIYYKATKKESVAFKVVFFCLVLAMLFFIYLNYLLYVDLGVSYNALEKSNDRYNQLYMTYNLNNSNNTALTSIPDLNLSIRRIK